MEHRGHCKSDECKGEEDERNVEIERHHVGEDGDGSDCRDDDLGEILSEEGLQSLDSLDQRQHKVAGPVPIRKTRTKFQRVVVCLFP